MIRHTRHERVTHVVFSVHPRTRMLAAKHQLLSIQQIGQRIQTSEIEIDEYSTVTLQNQIPRSIDALYLCIVTIIHLAKLGKFAMHETLQVLVGPQPGSPNQGSALSMRLSTLIGMARGFPATSHV